MKFKEINEEEEEVEDERYIINKTNKIRFYKSSLNNENSKKYFSINNLAIFILLFALSGTIYGIIKLKRNFSSIKGNLNKENFRILNISYPQNNITNDVKIYDNNLNNITNNKTNEILNNLTNNIDNNITNNSIMNNRSNNGTNNITKNVIK